MGDGAGRVVAMDAYGAAPIETALAALMLGRPLVTLDPSWPPARADAALGALPPFGPSSNDQPFYIGFTSGSSGPPKPFARRRRHGRRALRSIDGNNGLNKADVVAVPGALCHSLPLYGVMTALAAGAEALIAADKGRVRQFAKLMARRRATVLTATPSQLAQLARAVKAQRLDLTCVRLVLSGGANLPQALAEEIAAAFPAAEIRPYYGASELSYVAMWRAEDAPPPGSVGRPVPGVRVWIADVNGAPVAPGELGRIVVESRWRRRAI